MTEATIKINKADTLDWLNTGENSAELAEKYRAELEKRLAAWNTEMDITIEFGNTGAGGYKISVDDPEIRDELVTDYETICDQLTNDWGWAE